MKIAIIGMGASGASLASFLSTKEELEISIFEPALSRKNHLWGFWDDGSPAFEAARNCRQHSWDSLAFVHGEQRRQVDVPQSPYSVVNSRDFIQSCEKNLRDSARIIRESVTSLSENSREAIVKTVEREEGFDLVFDSRPPMFPTNTLQQHFLGRWVEMQSPVFDPETATLMDFRPRPEEPFHFIYVLPISRTRALIESTCYSPATREENWYRRRIHDYLQVWGEDYEILEEESGQIPLHSGSSSQGERIKSIGLRSGTLRASSGYAFAQNLIQSQKIAEQVFESVDLCIPDSCLPMEKWMDEVMLRLIRQRPEQAIEAMMAVPGALDGQDFTEFMTGHSKARARWSLIWGLPKAPMISAALGWQ